MTTSFYIKNQSKNSSGILSETAKKSTFYYKNPESIG